MPPNRAKYQEAIANSPPTLWTLVVKAGNPDNPEYRPALHRLLELYDTALLRFFESFARDREKAVDWKQDFCAEMLEGKRFSPDQRKGHHFRSYLARAVHNYVCNRREAEQAAKRKTAEGAKLFSQYEQSDSTQSFGETREAPAEATILGDITRAQGYDIVNRCYDNLQTWCRTQEDALDLLQVVESLKNPDADKTAGQLSARARKRVIEKRAEFIQQEVLQELYAAPGEDVAEVMAREIDELLRPLDSCSHQRPPMGCDDER